MPVTKASEALSWLTEDRPEKVLMWCKNHDQPVWMYDDGSWSCWWQTIVETSDETQCNIVSEIPTDMLVDKAKEIMDGQG